MCNKILVIVPWLFLAKLQLSGLFKKLSMQFLPNIPDVCSDVVRLADERLSGRGSVSMQAVINHGVNGCFGCGWPEGVRQGVLTSLL